jgi:exodeoxyribonuclease V beta subunit
MSAISDLDVFRCDLDGINLIEASAGTGKTWNICGLYLRLLLERDLDVQQILVVTFTNAATAELRERIRTRIVETRDYLKSGIAPGGDPFVSTLVAQLADQMNIAKDDMIRRLDLALSTFDEASIFTIHGFCQRALGDSPFAAGLPMAMELIQDDSDLLMESVHDFWRRHIAGDALPAELISYISGKGDTPEAYARLLKRHLAKPLAISRWPDDLDSEPTIDSDALRAAYAGVRRLWTDHRVAIADFLFSSLGSLNGTTYKETSVREGAAQWDELFRTSDPLAALGKHLRLYRDFTLNDRKKKGTTPPSHPFFSAAESFLALRETIDGALALRRLHLIRALLDEAGVRLRESKRARRVVSFDDMLFNVHERLTNGSYPGLAASLKARFPAALIDEFQDTDPLQFDIFRSIYGAKDTPLFLVGDPKQAIYSFRQADLHTYLRARQLATQEYSLGNNQRSSRELLAGLNSLFATNPRGFVLPGLDYRTVEFGDKPRSEFVDNSDPRAALQVWMLPETSEGPLSKKSARYAVTQAVAAEIARLLREAGDNRIAVAESPLRAGDIAVLVRSHAQGGEMKRALDALGVGSVEISQSSVFQSTDAEEVERVLTSVLEPTRDRLLRAALATELIGCDAAAVEAIAGDETALMERMLRFSDYREQWLRRGFGPMYRKLLATEKVAGRMLVRADGERRLTNLLHLGECLHQASETHPSPEALLRYLRGQRSEGSPDEAAQLRLESDQNLVKIITIHKAKGLEYPIVFCPYLWDGRTSFGGAGSTGAEYHNEDGIPVIDYRGDDVGKDEADEIKETIKLESGAEFLRLIYVALTRAVHRCYLVTGCYMNKPFGNPSVTESTRSMLNWLVAGNGQTPETWFEAKPTPADIAAAWMTLAAKEPASIDVSALPQGAGLPLTPALPDPASLSAKAAPSFIPGGWRLSSYSGLSYGAISEHAASDHDARIGSAPTAGVAPAHIAPEDILRFPRGGAAGECVHTVFEEADFTDRSTWDRAIALALESHPQTLPGLPRKEGRERLSAMLRQMLADVTGTEIIEGLRLDSVGRPRRLNELEFNFPVPDLSATGLNELLGQSGYPGPRLTFSRLEGYLKGFIDLIFEHQGRFYILDWKSNHLGFAMADYEGGPVANAMTEHGYHLQYLLYTVALDRYLQRRIPGYLYEAHFGGVFYLFVRGVRPGWRNNDGTAAGVYAHVPPREAIRQLNALFGAQLHSRSGQPAAEVTP